MYFKEFEILKRIELEALEQIKNFKKRDIFFEIPWEENGLILWWERWVGKTTLLLQKRVESENAFYFSADNVIIQEIGLFKFVYFLYNEKNIKNIFIDEIFKYKNWSIELKNIIDSLPNLKIYCSWSNSLNLFKGITDLWRRTLDIKIDGFSFREFLNFKFWYDFKKINFEEILYNHQNIASNILPQIKNFFSKWEEYIKKWIYPFWINLKEEIFFIKLERTLQRIIVEDLPSIRNFDTITIENLKKLFYFLSNIPPSELSISNLASKIWINKVTLSEVLNLLNYIWTIFLIPKYWNISDRIRKNYKILLSNPNKYFVYNLSPDIGTIRESTFIFFIKHIKNLEIFYWWVNDYIIKILDKTFNFEIGWKSKIKRKNKYKNTFLILDNLDISNDKNIIPLWLFGFLR